jgi:hypothetical protein
VKPPTNLAMMVLWTEVESDLGSNQACHGEPSMWSSTVLSSSMMAESLFRVDSGITTGSWCTAGVERFSASSTSHRAFVSFASIFSRRSCRNIKSSLPLWGKEGTKIASRTTIAGAAFLTSPFSSRPIFCNANARNCPHLTHQSGWTVHRSSPYRPCRARTNLR